MSLGEMGLNIISQMNAISILIINMQVKFLSSNRKVIKVIFYFKKSRNFIIYTLKNMKCEVFLFKPQVSLRIDIGYKTQVNISLNNNPQMIRGFSCLD